MWAVIGVYSGREDNISGVAYQASAEGNWKRREQEPSVRVTLNRSGTTSFIQ